MRWEAADVRRYLAWFETPRGRFAVSQEMRLLDYLVSGWPRRNQKLLEVGCGPGVFLERFWHLGFDISGLDISPAMIDAARTRLGKHTDLHVGNAEHLPFGDNDFDFVLVITLLELADDPEAVLREAVRVARKGILVAYLNRYSLYHLEVLRKKRFAKNKPDGKSSHTTLGDVRWLDSCTVRSMLYNAAGSRTMQRGSCLFGPPATWRSAFPWTRLNGILPNSLGSFAAVRLDLLDDPPLTPLLSFSAKSAGPAA
ncbi:class I SAM-dependent methyltransferase [Oceanidesulfovibrio marinus]|uniref:Class I SAM-dependent methyltransferase n=1 Tax=Oceanidesulfovibrio marinus TaxID=370038 RepID=A0ABX6NJ15_9BACT|nr:class I SAM-dependent methyltransferase [Oceanidesulfovibrio marinus]QJT10043.1 class I SAM-dependent methyltransferase [Oceanidesulfovibrio marinus]